MRSQRIDHIGTVLAPGPRFLAGMLMLPPFLLSNSLPIKAGLATLFAFLALLAGKRLRWAYFLLLILSVVFFHLLNPIGRVLMEIGSLAITAGALENGLTRGFTLLGMVFLSIAAVRPELELPGHFGGLLGRTFYYFDAIIEGKNQLSRKNFFLSLDKILMERFNPNREELAHEKTPETETSRRGWSVLIPLILIPWLLWVWEILRG